MAKFTVGDCAFGAGRVEELVVKTAFACQHHHWTRAEQGDSVGLASADLWHTATNDEDKTENVKEKSWRKRKIQIEWEHLMCMHEYCVSCSRKT